MSQRKLARTLPSAMKADEEAALRFKTLAEKKFQQSSLKAALKNAKRAQRLSPNLDGISEMVTAFRVLRAASKSPPDWYKILQLEPFSHTNTVKKQYKKLALTLHPDKNSCLGSEEAFKRVGEAFRFLSDKVRRKEYDLKLRLELQSQARDAEKQLVVAVDTFWTACSTCELLHQFERRYLGQQLVCPGCKESFSAEEYTGLISDNEENEVVDEADDDVSLGVWRSARVRAAKKRKILAENSAKMVRVSDSLGKSDLEKRKTSGRREKTLAELQLEAKRKAEMAKSKMKLRENKEKGKEGKEVLDEAPVSQSSEFVSKRKSKENKEGNELEKALVSQSSKLVLKRKTMENKEGNELDKDLVSQSSDLVSKRKSKENDEKEKKGNELDKDLVSQSSELVSKRKSRENNEKEKKENVMEKALASQSGELGSKRKSKENKEKEKKGKEVTEKALVKSQNNELVSFMVEDSDFYDFDKDRMEKSFKKGQAWAVYDDDDGMPRHYGLIDEVVSVNPFVVKMSWLDLQSNCDDALTCWEKMGFHVSCGRFKVARKVDIDSVNLFSHIVECERAAKEVYRIYPKKGSVWALYREGAVYEDNDNLNLEQRHFYDIVVFLTSYSEMHGLSMAYLEKIEGFKTLFKRREIGCHAITWLEKDNIRLFSHQIPARKLSGEEASDLPKDCWELDPASLPEDLLRICG